MFSLEVIVCNGDVLYCSHCDIFISHKFRMNYTTGNNETQIFYDSDAK